MGRRYEADEWVEFLTEPGTPRAATKRLAKKFSDKVARMFDPWSTAEHGYVLPADGHMVAYKTFGTLVGHGFGLDDGDVLSEADGRAFVRVAKADRGLVGLAHDLDGLISVDSAR